jgi:acyl-CoA reductase-like NAD-dependent aldehyde dehydrogenase
MKQFLITTVIVLLATSSSGVGRDLAQCRAVASAIEAGIVGVNEWRPLKAEIPFGGIKQSGIGAESGEEGLREFLETQVISMPKPIIAS